MSFIPLVNINRGLWKQKPNAWGNEDDVAGNLKDRLEAIGIDYTKVEIAIPFFNPGNQINYAKPTTGINYGADYEQNSLQFDGEQNNANSDRIEVPCTPSNLFGSNKTTLLFQLYKTDSIALNGITSCGLPGSNALRWLLSDDERAGDDFTFTTRTSSWYEVSWAGVHLRVNAKDTLVLTWDGVNTLELFINADSKGTKTFAVSQFGSTALDVIIGAGNATTSNSNFWGFQGRIEEALFIADKFSTDQIASLYENPWQLWHPKSYTLYSFGADEPTTSLYNPIPMFNTVLQGAA